MYLTGVGSTGPTIKKMYYSNTIVYQEQAISFASKYELAAHTMTRWTWMECPSSEDKVRSANAFLSSMLWRFETRIVEWSFHTRCEFSAIVSERDLDSVWRFLCFCDKDLSKWTTRYPGTSYLFGTSTEAYGIAVARQRHRCFHCIYPPMLRIGRGEGVAQWIGAPA